MYGAKLPAVAGVAILPATGDNKVLFYVAVSLIASGLAIAAINFVMSRKTRRQAAK